MANEELIQIIKRSPHYLYKKLVRDLTLDLKFKVQEDFDNWIYVDNESPICLVAHIDTVDRDEKLKIKVNRNVITANDSVLGADDRAGVYAIMTLLRKCREEEIAPPSVIFTNYEETGCKGARKFCEDNKFNKEGCNFFIELDRRGSVDYVFYSDDLPDEVEEYIESFGFCKANGSCSDVQHLTKKYKIPHVNLSVGYYSQHTRNERLHIDELELTIDRVFKILKSPIDKLYEVEDKPAYSYNNAKRWNHTTKTWYGEGDYNYDDYGYGSYGSNRMSVVSGNKKKKPGSTAKVYVLNRNKKLVEEVEYGKPTPEDIIDAEFSEPDEFDGFNWEQNAFMGV